MSPSRLYGRVKLMSQTGIWFFPSFAAVFLVSLLGSAEKDTNNIQESYISHGRMADEGAIDHLIQRVENIQGNTAEHSLQSGDGDKDWIKGISTLKELNLTTSSKILSKGSYTNENESNMTMNRAAKNGKKIWREFGNQDINEFCYSPSDSLKCYQDPIFCETFHLSGKRELQWPAYGEYSFLPHKHWVKVLQHGGVVFLYHPCTDNSSISKLRRLADSCMHRYVLTKCSKLSPEKPLALVSWGCFLLMKHVDFKKCKDWIKSHAYKGPASHIHKNGTYENKLVRPAKVITDIKDTMLCPDEEEKAALFASISTFTARISTLTARMPSIVRNKHKHVGEEIILKRLEKAKHRTVSRLVPGNYVKVDTKKSMAAFGSLVFLFVLLLVLLLYTKLWRPKFPLRKFAYTKLGDLDAQAEGRNYESSFSLLKTGQAFISSLKHGRRERKQYRPSKLSLLAPISENEYEMEDF